MSRLEQLKKEMACWQKLAVMSLANTDAEILLELPNTGSTVDCGMIHSEVRQIIRRQQHV